MTITRKKEYEMHEPPHPGEVLRELYLEPLELTVTETAKRLGVTRKTLSELVNGRAGVSPEMALRLSKGLGRSPESWLAMQDNFDLWHARQRVDIDDIESIPLSG